jgi:hypothetical protein
MDNNQIEQFIKIGDRIANSLERITELMEDEDKRRRRRTINELNEQRREKRKDRKKPKLDPSKAIPPRPEKKMR